MRDETARFISPCNLLTGLLGIDWTFTLSSASKNPRHTAWGHILVWGGISGSFGSYRSYGKRSGWPASNCGILPAVWTSNSCSGAVLRQLWISGTEQISTTEHRGYCICSPCGTLGGAEAAGTSPRTLPLVTPSDHSPVGCCRAGYCRWRGSDDRDQHPAGRGRHP